MAKLFGGSGNPDFADRASLASDGTFFCITDAKLHQQKDGRVKWYLTINRANGEDIIFETLTFDRTPARDRGFQELIDTGGFPVHNVWLEKRSFQGAKGTMSFYDMNFEQDKTSCPCGWLGAGAA